MVKSPLRYVSDIHRRPLPDCLKPLEDLNAIGGILFFRYSRLFVFYHYLNKKNLPVLKQTNLRKILELLVIPDYKLRQIPAVKYGPFSATIKFLITVLFRRFRPSAQTEKRLLTLYSAVTPRSIHPGTWMSYRVSDEGWKSFPSRAVAHWAESPAKMRLFQL